MLFPKPKRLKDQKLMTSYHSTQHCIVCGLAATPAHIKGVGAGGDDTEENMAPLCGIHHTMQGSMGMTSFAAKYETFRLWLLAHGWELNEFLNKWRKV